MKKYLLFACAAIMSLSASAQAYKQSVMDNERKVAMQKAMFTQGMEAGQLAKVSKTSRPAKAPAVIEKDGIYGLYIMTRTDYQENSAGCDSVIISKANIKDEEGNTYNTKIQMPQLGYNSKTQQKYDASTVLYGNYDAATNKITCPIQSAINHPTYGNIYAMAWVGDLSDIENVSPDQTNPFTFTVNDDGSVDLDQTGLWFYMTDYAEKNPEEGATWNNWFNVSLKPANAVMHFEIRARDDSGNYTGEMDKYNTAVAVEDFTYNINVHGAYSYGAMAGNANGFGLSTSLMINVNEDMSVTMPTGQNVWSTEVLGFSDDDIASFGDYYFVQGITDNKADVNGAGPQGTLEGNTITFDYVPIFTKWVYNDEYKQNVAYGNWYYNNTIVLDNGGYVAGINDVNAGSVKAAKDAKFYNAFGQQVSRNAKGLVISNGKKFINK